MKPKMNFLTLSAYCHMAEHGRLHFEPKATTPVKKRLWCQLLEQMVSGARGEGKDKDSGYDLEGSEGRMNSLSEEIAPTAELLISVTGCGEAVWGLQP